MPIVEILANGNKLEVSPESTVAITKQIKDLLTFSSVLANKTNQFKIPRGRINDSILRTAKYEKIECKVLFNGYPVVQSGELIIRDENEDNYTVYIYSGNFDIFKSIKDFEFSDSTLLIYSPDSISSGWQARYGFYSISENPFPNDGDIVLDETSVNLIQNYRDYFDLVFSDIGYTANYPVSDPSDPFENSFFTPSKRLSHEKKVFSYTMGSPVNIPIGDSIYLASIPSIDPPTPPTGVVNLTAASNEDYCLSKRHRTNLSNPDDTYGWKFFQEGTMSFTFNLQSVTGSYNVKIVKFNTLDFSVLPVTVESLGSFTGSIDISVEKNDFIQVEIEQQGGAAIDIEMDLTLEWKANEPLYVNSGETYFLNFQFEGLSADKLLKEYLTLSGYMISTDEFNKEVNFIRISDVFNNKGQALDFSDKAADFSYKKQYRPSGIAQNNKFRYNSVDELSEDFGSAIVVIDNESLDENKTIVNSSFSPVDKTTFNGVELPIFPAGRSTILEEVFSAAIVFDVIESKFANTNNTATVNSSSALSFDRYEFSYLLANNLSWFSSLYENFEEISLMFNLKLIDVNKFLFDKLIYLNVANPYTLINGYFFVNSINNFQGSDKLVELKLIKIN